ncbi:transposon Ty3-G Gag-Pol polyprotein [Trichonephila clavata]|uniref:Transposon Ty3-G Gag-Pol polyprotein n=1 Tax=Trichonephila clavata TaxID=2740835 RepID=A0A8X6KJI9_TRICU|nr:transposon Ty3-G Gag-Pol polyprotein [Trichonephila clavata]
MISSYHNGQSEIWITNLQSGNQIIPKGMYLGLVEPLDESHLCVISDSSHVPALKHEMSYGNKRQESPRIDCSLMMSPELIELQKRQLAELLGTFSGIFTKTDKSVTTGTNVKHGIHTGKHARINQRVYRVSPTERLTIHNEVQKILEIGIIQPSDSPWSSPVVLVRK